MYYFFSFVEPDTDLLKNEMEKGMESVLYFLESPNSKENILTWLRLHLINNY